MRQDSTGSGRNPDLQTTGHLEKAEDELDGQASKNESESKLHNLHRDKPQDNKRNIGQRQVHHSLVN